MGHTRRGHSAQAAAAHRAPAHLSTWGCPRVRRCLDRWLSPVIAFTIVTKRSHREKHPPEKHLGRRRHGGPPEGHHHLCAHWLRPYSIDVPPPALRRRGRHRSGGGSGG